MNFLEIGPAHAPENWNFGKISEWVFQDSLIRVKSDGYYDSYTIKPEKAVVVYTIRQRRSYQMVESKDIWMYQTYLKMYSQI